MALIKCPECGRDNVSDSALACPCCGFGIREYFSKQTKEISTPQKEEQTQENKIEEKPNVNVKETTIKKSNDQSGTKPKAVRCKKCGALYSSDFNKCPTCNTNKSFSQTISQVKTSQDDNYVRKPNKPIFKGGYIIGIIIGVVLFLLGIPLFNQSEYKRSYSMNHGNGDPHFYGGFLFVLGIAIIAITIGIFVRGMSRYNLYMNDRDAYRKMVNEENLKAAQRYKAQRQAEEARLAKLPECPICKSKRHVRRISSLDRGVSVAMVGLASSKIGKQYECTNCKHKF